MNLLVLFLHVMFVVPGFVSATDMRPADVLTSALGNAQAVPGSALFAHRTHKVLGVDRI